MKDFSDLFGMDDKTFDEMKKLARKNEEKWLSDYSLELKNRKLWDIDFLDYKCYRVFIIIFKDKIEMYKDDFLEKHRDKLNISFKEVSWVLYFMATDQGHRLEEYQKSFQKDMTDFITKTDYAEA
jgi:hypothetical protein